MSTSEKNACCQSINTLNWNNIVVLLIVFIFGILTGIVTQYADRCPFLNPQPVDPSVQVDEQVRQRLQMALRHEQNLYVRKIQDWKKPYAEKVNAVLTPEQLKQLAGPRRPYTQASPDGKPATTPPDVDMTYPYRRGDRMARALTEMLSYQLQLDNLGQKVTLTDKQKAAIAKIFMQRRDDFLKFIDQNPPPKSLPQYTMEDSMAMEMEVEFEEN